MRAQGKVVAYAASNEAAREKRKKKTNCTGPPNEFSSITMIRNDFSPSSLREKYQKFNFKMIALADAEIFDGKY